MNLHIFKSYKTHAHTEYFLNIIRTYDTLNIPDAEHRSV